MILLTAALLLVQVEWPRMWVDPPGSTTRVTVRWDEEFQGVRISPVPDPPEPKEVTKFEVVTPRLITMNVWCVSETERVIPAQAVVTVGIHKYYLTLGAAMKTITVHGCKTAIELWRLFSGSVEVLVSNPL